MATLMICACAALMVATAMVVMPTPLLVAATVVLGWSLLVLAAIDAGTFRLPDPLTLPLALAGLGVSWMLPGQPLGLHAAAAAVAYLAFSAIASAFLHFRGHEAMGPGDAKLAAVAGAWLGLAALPSTIVIACAVAFVWIALRAATRGRRVLAEPLPFGPPLALAIWVAWLCGPFMP
jgi:leader peptidase (prepilin peptidase)/N-methyltransferase